MSQVTTHILDLMRGHPAAGVFVRLERLPGSGPMQLLAEGRTDTDGRLTTLLQPDTQLEPGSYQLIFDTAAYFASTGAPCFYPTVQVTFIITDPAARYHLPLLLSAYGYSTYRGS